MYVRVAARENSEDVELPCEADNTILLTTLQAQYPSAIGLKYRSSTGGWRAIRLSEKALDPPLEGWADTIYYVTESDARKRKAGDMGGRSKASLLQDLIVLGLPFSASEEELKEYFTSACGELAFSEIKLDRNTKRSRGFGFIRFNSEEAAKEALNGKHEIGGRRLEIRLSKQNEGKAMKLFIGRLKEGITKEDLTDYFSEFGDLTDVFVPSPFRGFGFVTFASELDGQRALRMSHILQGARLNVTLAEPRDEKRPKNDTSDYTWNPNNSSNSQYNQNGANFNPKSKMDNDLKNMLFQYLNNQK